MVEKQIPNVDKKGEPLVVKEVIGQQLGNLDDKPVFCGNECNECPIKNGHIGVRVNYVVKNGKCVKLQCIDYK